MDIEEQLKSTHIKGGRLKALIDLQGLIIDKKPQNELEVFKLVADMIIEEMEGGL